MDLVLASASPRRKDLLSQLGYSPIILPVDIDESVGDESPSDYVHRMALEKLQAAQGRLSTADNLSFSLGPDFVVLTADTICAIDGHILVKPCDFDDFKEMMRRMSGCKHEVMSSFALGVVEGGDDTLLHHEVVKTDVYFRELSELEIRAYWETNEPVDKAGGYGIQGIGAAFVERIEGSYSNVVGLPLMQIHQTLKAAGVVSAL